MTETIEAESAGRIAARQSGPDSQAAALAAAVRTRRRPASRSTTVAGPEHGAQATAETDEAMRRGAGGPAPHAAQAFELALHRPHRAAHRRLACAGGTGATNAALTGACLGARTALITVSGGRAPRSDLVVETGELDQGWCHTVGYLSPILAAAAVGGHLTGTPLDGDAAAAVLAAGLADTAGAERIAARFADAAHLIVIASGADRASGRELTLKVEEASWLPSAYRDLETFLHGQSRRPTRRRRLSSSRRPRRSCRAARPCPPGPRGRGPRAGSPVRGDPRRRPRRRAGPDLTSAGRLLVEAPDSRHRSPAAGKRDRSSS
jgi:hypothetical protein